MLTFQSIINALYRDNITCLAASKNNPVDSYQSLVCLPVKPNCLSLLSDIVMCTFNRKHLSLSQVVQERIVLSTCLLLIRLIGVGCYTYDVVADANILM